MAMIWSTNMNARDFVITWQTSETVEEAAAKLGISPGRTLQLARRLRRMKVNLKYMPGLKLSHIRITRTFVAKTWHDVMSDNYCPFRRRVSKGTVWEIEMRSDEDEHYFCLRGLGWVRLRPRNYMPVPHDEASDLPSVN
jgi:hypothetical protein